ncbi:MAG: hypothetical protein M1826_002402 [Phylliscum demangeonii]|nr:MAG: hypothetical protein M1826_002402 [Phylliscum demangeonii]
MTSLDDYSDDDLNAAIALSLGNRPPARRPSPTQSLAPARKPSEVIDLTNDSDETEDSDATESEDHFPTSKVQPDENPQTGHGTEPRREDSPPQPALQPGAGQAFSLLALDRKQMEQDRLNRRKRKASISPPRLKRFKRDEPSKGVDVDASKRLPKSPRRTSTPPRPRLPPQPRSASSSGIQYPDGVVKKTWAYGYPRADDIKIEEVLQKGTLTTAMLSAFQWEMDWLMRKVDLNKTKLILAMQAKDESTKARYRLETTGVANLRLCFPPMPGNVNCMHSKLQLLFHPTHLRIVVPSANLTSYDWGEAGGILENVVFLIDLPRCDAGLQTPAQARSELTFFGQELVYFLEAMGLQREVVDGVLKFDFSATQRYALVHTIGGPHTGEDWRRTGYCGLGRAVHILGAQHDGPLDIEYVTSSVGSLNDAFLRAIYLAAQGDDGLTEYHCRVDRPSKRKTEASGDEQDRAAEVTKQMDDHFRIYFPTRETVLGSRGSSGAGGTICLQSRWYHAPTFPQRLFRDCESQRPGMLMHNKMLFARPQGGRGQAHGPTGTPWAYVGSANLSESAWGRLSLDRTTKAPKMNCRNWECGVVIPVSSTAAGADVGMDVFSGLVPVPMRVPGRGYGSQLPWFGSEHGT